MPSRSLQAVAASAAFTAAAFAHAQAPIQTPAQQPAPIASVSRADASVTSPVAAIAPAADGRAIIAGNSAIAAKDHTAPIALTRGGELRLCRGSSLHLAPATGNALQIALDRGSFELRGKASAGDVIQTPDLRITLAAAATLDLQMRVSANGDTCLDNRGRGAPTLNLSESFGEAAYQLKPGQHVTFEHGSLHEVVDRETVPCGCPPDEPHSVSLADAMLAGGATSRPVTPAQAAAAAHPFPAAESEGLAEPSPPPAAPAGVTNVQVATDLRYDPNAPKQPTPDQAATALSEAQPSPAPQPNPDRNPLHAIGRFFHNLFVR